MRQKQERQACALRFSRVPKFTCACSAENPVCSQRKSREVAAVFRFFDRFCRSVLITSIRERIHQGHKGLSGRSRGRQCAFMALAALLFNRSGSIDPWTQQRTNIDDILCHGDRRL